MSQSNKEDEVRRWVEIEFECLPLRSVGRLDAPLDASPAWKAFCDRVARAIHQHGAHNAYYLHRGTCRYHLTNTPHRGLLEFTFEGTVLTDAEDRHTVSSDLTVSLYREVCDWLTQPIVDWFCQTVVRAVEVEFDRFIEAGDLEKTRRRIEKIEQTIDEKGGYLGMYL